jgi:hypothetical protein
MRRPDITIRSDVKAPVKGTRAERATAQRWVDEQLAHARSLSSEQRERLRALLSRPPYVRMSPTALCDIKPGRPITPLRRNYVQRVTSHGRCQSGTTDLPIFRSLDNSFAEYR